MGASELQNNISKYLTAETDRKYWDATTLDERDRFVVILKADGLAEAIRQVKQCASAQAKSDS